MGNFAEIQNEFSTKLNNEISRYSKNSGIQIENITVQKINEIKILILRDMRMKRNNELFQYTNRNLIVYYSGFVQLCNTYNAEFSITDNDMNGFMNAVSNLDKSKGLDLILQTPGGGITATESIINYLRKIFKNDIRVIVPHLAMSAGTLIAASSKEIIIGKESSLGPVDPQCRNAPALGIIQEFNTAQTDIKSDPQRILIWREIFAKYPPAYLIECVKSVELTEDILKNNLKTVMFRRRKNNQTIIDNIVNELMNKNKNKVHDRHFDYLKCKNMGLKVTNFEDDPILQEKVLSVYHTYFLSIYSGLSYIKLIEAHNGNSMIFNS